MLYDNAFLPVFRENPQISTIMSILVPQSINTVSKDEKGLLLKKVEKYCSMTSTRKWFQKANFIANKGGPWARLGKNNFLCYKYFY